jgi:hypothetical protein
VCYFWFRCVEWQKPWNFANNLVNIVSELIENEAFICQSSDFKYFIGFPLCAFKVNVIPSDG